MIVPKRVIGRSWSMRVSASRILSHLITMPYSRMRLHNTDFTIVSSNCLGARIYQELGLQYNTPFVGLSIYAPDYIKLLTNFEFYIMSDLSFIDKSKYSSVNASREHGKHYPIGLLNGEIEVHFIHYRDEEEALKKWKRRVQRMNMKNLFFMFTDQDFCNETLLEQFDHTHFEHKVCFTARELPEIKSSIWVNEYQGQPSVGEMYTNFHILQRHFDFISWLNGKDRFRRK